MFQQRSVFGIMNLIGCWFGAMPCCHGAGGPTEQYKFGGRSEGCVTLLGVAKLVLGLILGSSLVKILDQFSIGVLGVFLLFDRIELAMCSRDMNSKEESVVMLICTVVSLCWLKCITWISLWDFCFLWQEDKVCSNLVPQLSAIICISNIELELSQC
ncbi:Molybdate transporter 1 [Abeliophyllum distichum]|uniref:Molybdate transporter 1 n=1 Tax=Abeliophyllum distichum TaxID=126358 RepID=A0ABD1SZ34_9LAMI